MSDERVRRAAEEALHRLSADLEAGRSETLKNYLDAMGRFHRYSWGNVLLIASQRPSATRVAGFHTWHDLGRWVKKGEKGIMIFAPVRVRQPEPSAGPEKSSRDEVFQLKGFRTAYVYDAAQTEGRPLPEFAKTAGDPTDYATKLKAFVGQRGIELTYDATISPAHGVSSGGQIRLMPGLSAAEEFSVLAHELAHEMLHHRKDASLPPKLVRETQAEAVAFVVCRAVGLETNTAAADYIALYHGDKKTLAESFSLIRETSAQILDELLPDQRFRPLEENPPNTATPEISHEDSRPLYQDSAVWDR